ncbi:Protein of unknown function [Gryllus bimaculatus]|nr:Protein of unknown function [Gryllus bimaculatus]
MGCLLTKVAMLPSTLQPEKSVRKNVKILREVNSEDSEDSSFRFNEYDRALGQIDAPNIETYDAINEIQLRWLPVFRSPSEHIADINAAFEMRRV